MPSEIWWGESDFYNSTNTSDATTLAAVPTTASPSLDETVDEVSLLNSSTAQQDNRTAEDTWDTWPKYREIVLHSGAEHGACDARDKSAPCPSCMHRLSPAEGQCSYSVAL